MSDIVDFIAQGDADLRPALERAVAEIERLGAALEQTNEAYCIGCPRREAQDAEIERLKARLQLAQRWAAEAADALQPSAEENTQLRAEVERLRAEGAGRYWEGRWRDADKEIERLKSALQRVHRAVGNDALKSDIGDIAQRALARAALEGKSR